MKEGKKGFFGRLLASIGNIFKSVFEGAEKTFEDLPGKLQDALKFGAGLIDIINKNVAHTPEFVVDIIKKAFPLFDEEHFLAALQKAGADTRDIADKIEGKNLIETIEIIKEYLAELKGTDGKEWAKKSSFFAQAIAFFTAPPQTKYSMIVSMIDMVYHKFFKDA